MAKIFLTAQIDVDNLYIDGDRDAFELIKAADDKVGTIEFTRRVYEYARDLLIAEGEDL